MRPSVPSKAYSVPPEATEGFLSNDWPNCLDHEKLNARIILHDPCFSGINLTGTSYYSHFIDPSI